MAQVRTVSSNRTIAINGLVLVLLGCWASLAIAAEPTHGYSVELVEIWVRGGVSPERAWTRNLSKLGVSFQVDSATEARLRAAGADDDWIAVLRRARFNPPPTIAPPEDLSRYPYVPAYRPLRRSFSRDDLKLLYFGRQARVTTYVGTLQLEETGGDVQGYVVNGPQGPVPLRSVPLPEAAPSYGLAVDYGEVGLDLEGVFEEDILMLNLGVRYTPFIPLGTSGFRLIVGAKPFVGITRQTLGRVPAQTTSGEQDEIDILNNTVGGDVIAGMAYHWRSGSWIYAEAAYRATKAYSRELRIPGNDPISEGIPWSEWEARGVIVRFGIGF